MKRCSRCNGDYPLNAFRRDASRLDGFRAYCRACASKADGVYREGHREETNARVRAWRADHPDYAQGLNEASGAGESAETLMVRDAHRRASRGHAKTYQKAYREAHRAEKNVAARARHKINAEQDNARHSAWRKAHPDEARAIDGRRWGRRHQAFTIPFTVRQLAEKMAYWGNRCWICGGPEEARDHVKPLAKGGAHVLVNLRPICNTCNSSKGAKWPLPQLLAVFDTT